MREHHLSIFLPALCRSLGHVLVGLLSMLLVAEPGGVQARQNHSTLSREGEIADEGNSVLGRLEGLLPAPVSLTGARQFPLNRASQQVDASPLDAEQVRRAINLGANYLKGEQNEDGSWLNASRINGGVPAVVTLALLNAGEPPDSVRMRKAIDFIRAYPRNYTYSVALRVMVLAAADPSGQKYRSTMQQDVDWLLQFQLPNGGWTYQQIDKSAGGDGSNSQFALLALHEASRAGIKVPREKWELAKDYWLKLYNERNGSFQYSPGVDRQQPSGSMTCAGIASWIIINENLFDPAQAANGEFANCCQPNPDMDLLNLAFNWLADRYTVRTNPVGDGSADVSKHLYYLYALERAGRFTGRRFIGPHDWNRDGAKLLLTMQQRSGAWQGRRPGVEEDNRLVATSFALLFLSKGKRPVAIGKFDHGVADWDLHPRGLHYLTRRLESEWDMKLNWQTVRAEGATVDDLFETPVLFMSGREAIGLTADQKQTLKKYIENGGFLFAEACQGDGCANGLYDLAFRELMQELFPDSKLEPLDPAHPIWNSHFPILPSPERPLLGLQACCRTSVVYCPANLSCYWALGQPAVMEDLGVNPRLKQRIEYAQRVGVNVIAYATGRELREKGDTPRLVENDIQQLTDRAMVFPKLNHNGGADDAPNAWEKVLDEVRTTAGLEIKAGKKMIQANLEQLADYPFVFIHGRNQFSFTAGERAALRQYLEMGGFLFADSICASEEFARSFREEMKQILGIPLSAIPGNHEIWSDPRFGERIDTVTVRTRDAAVAGGFRDAQQAPAMEGVALNGRLAVVFSPLDLSCALENTTVSNCNGYTRADALRLARNVILYSLLSDAQANR